MGEPAVPSKDDRYTAYALALRVLDAIRNDEPVASVFGDGRPGRLPYNVDRVMWLLASTLVWCVDESPAAEEYDVLLGRR